MQSIPYVDKDQIDSSHSVIRSMLANIKSGTEVIDVGCGPGGPGRMLQGKGIELDGIEPDQGFAEIARPFYRRIHVCTLSDAPDELFQGREVVVCADVLEHLENPEGTLLRLVQVAGKGTQFLISVPNIANIWIRMNLLFGRFEYTDRGILDRTHLKHFTRATFVDLLEHAGLHVAQLEVTPIPLPLVSKFFIENAIGRVAVRILSILTHWFPTLLGYQFVTKALKY